MGIIRICRDVEGAWASADLDIHSCPEDNPPLLLGATVQVQLMLLSNEGLGHSVGKCYCFQ